MTELSLTKRDLTRFWSKVAPSDANGCRMWTGDKGGRGGYGRLGAKSRRWYVHRIAWVHSRGPIPRSKEIDHWRLNEVLLPSEFYLCSKLCITHLRLLGGTANRQASPLHNASKIRCPQGHLYSRKNTQVHSTGRHCRRCGRDRARAKYRKINRLPKHRYRRP